MHNTFLYDVTSVHVGSGFYFTLFCISAYNSGRNFYMLLTKCYKRVHTDTFIGEKLFCPYTKTGELGFWKDAYLTPFKGLSTGGQKFSDKTSSYLKIFQWKCKIWEDFSSQYNAMVKRYPILTIPVWERNFPVTVKEGKVGKRFPQNFTFWRVAVWKGYLTLLTQNPDLRVAVGKAATKWSPLRREKKRKLPNIRQFVKAKQKNMRHFNSH